MNEPYLSKLYKCLLLLVQQMPSSIIDISSIQEEIADADNEFLQDISRFNKEVEELIVLIEKNDQESISSRLVYLSVYLSNLTTIFSNAKDEVNKLIKERPQETFNNGG